MNFYDTITEMGYTMAKTDTTIEITKQDIFPSNGAIGEIHIVFYIEEKKIIGYVEPIRKIYDLTDISHLYNNLFLAMQKDLKFFAEKSKYDII